jgi:Spy/CpxP family protein refolding chaperone
MKRFGRVIPAAAFAGALLLSAAQAQTAAPCAGLPPGRHALLERLTASLNLTCEQQLKIEPLLHAEESVTKPLLGFTSLSADDQQAIMTTIKLAARRQVRTLLTPEQQKGMDSEVDSVSKGGGKKKKGDAKKADVTPGLQGEETLCEAVVAYAALTPGEKNAMLLKVKRAALDDPALQLTPAQQKKLDTEIQNLKK